MEPPQCWSRWWSSPMVARNAGIPWNWRNMLASRNWEGRDTGGFSWLAWGISMYFRCWGRNPCDGGGLSNWGPTSFWQSPVTNEYFMKWHRLNEAPMASLASASLASSWPIMAWHKVLTVVRPRMIHSSLTKPYHFGGIIPNNVLCHGDHRTLLVVHGARVVWVWCTSAAEITSSTGVLWSCCRRSYC